MSQTHEIREGDRLPTLRAIAFTDDERVDLTQFESIVFRMLASDGTTIVDDAAATGDANGNLEYAWADGDTDTPGTYTAVFIATDGAGKTQTFPTASNLTVVIVPEL